MTVTDEMNNRHMEIVKTIIHDAFHSRDLIAKMQKDGWTKAEIVSELVPAVNIRTLRKWKNGEFPIPMDRQEQFILLYIYKSIELAAVQETRLYAPWKDGTTTFNDHASLSDEEIETIISLHSSSEWANYARKTRDRLLNIANAVLANNSSKDCVRTCNFPI